MEEPSGTVITRLPTPVAPGVYVVKSSICSTPLINTSYELFSVLNTGSTVAGSPVSEKSLLDQLKAWLDQSMRQASHKIIG
ncbi:hypothetical protein SRABI134_01665 [Peribacillus sp. Bi134]|nr:hypothetical protein SRABI134_01665 [Peribacillus sp. Bi134]